MKKKKRKKKIHKRRRKPPSTPPPSALIVVQKYVLVWCYCPKNKNPTASLVCLPWGMLSFPLSDRYGSSSPPGF